MYNKYITKVKNCKRLSTNHSLVIMTIYYDQVSNWDTLTGVATGETGDISQENKIYRPSQFYPRKIYDQRHNILKPRTCLSPLFTPILPATTLYKRTATAMTKFLVLTMFIRRMNGTFDTNRLVSNIQTDTYFRCFCKLRK